MKRRISVEGEQGDSGGRMEKGEAMQGCDVLSQALELLMRVGQIIRDPSLP